MGAGACGLGQGQRHIVLQLVAKAIGTTGLIKGGAGLDATRERLIRQPAIDHDVHGAVGRFDFKIAQGIVPVLLHLCQLCVRVGCAHFSDQCDSCVFVCALAQQMNELDAVARGQGKGIDHCQTGIKPGTNPA